MRIRELSKEVGLSNNVLLKKLDELGITGKKPASGLTGEEEKKLRELIAGEKKAVGSADVKPDVRKERPKTEKPRTEKPKTEKPKTEKPKTEKPRTEKPGAEEQKSEGQKSQDGEKRRRRRRRNRRNRQQESAPTPTSAPAPAPEPVIQEAEEDDISIIELPPSVTVGELAERIGRKPTEIIMKLMSMGVMATINNEIDRDTCEKICED